MNISQRAIAAAVTTLPQAIGYLETIILFMERQGKEIAQLKAELDKLKKDGNIII